MADMTEQKWVNIAPTPQGLVQIERLFRETITRSETIIGRCEHTLLLLDTGDYVIDYDHPEIPFLTEAIEAYASQERQRIASMHDGLADMGKKE